MNNDSWSGIINNFRPEYFKKLSIYPNTEKKTMETKSRYQIIQELEEKRRELTEERDSINNISFQKARQVKVLERQLEDLKEDVAQFELEKPQKVKTYDELIKSVTESLNKIQSQS